MAGLRVSFSLIPQGDQTKVDLEIRGDFLVSNENAQREAEYGIVQLVARISNQPEDQIRTELGNEKWFGFQKADEDEKGSSGVR